MGIPYSTDNLDEFITVRRDTWERMKKRLGRLYALEAAGVDNWEGYPQMDDDDDEEDE